MSASHPLPRLLAGITCSLAICFGVQALVFFGLDGAAVKTESNYFSSLARFQRAKESPAEIVLIGSSITGRLDGKWRRPGMVANLGADGGSALDGLEVLNSGTFLRSNWIVVETNTLYNQIGFQRIPVVTGSQGTWFHVGTRVPLLGASARPSGMLYSKLGDRGGTGPEAPPFTIALSAVRVSSEISAIRMEDYEQLREEELIEGLERLRRSGSKILLVRYPAGEMLPRNVALMEKTVSDLAEVTGAQFLDLATQIPRDQLIFTDGVHLNPESAARILDSILQVCRE